MRVGRIYILNNSDTNQVSPICLKTAPNAILTTQGFFDTINIHTLYIAVAERVLRRSHHHFQGKTLGVSLLTMHSDQLGKSEALKAENFSDSEKFQNHEQVSCFLQDAMPRS